MTISIDILYSEDNFLFCSTTTKMQTLKNIFKFNSKNLVSHLCVIFVLNSRKIKYEVYNFDNYSIVIYDNNNYINQNNIMVFGNQTTWKKHIDAKFNNRNNISLLECQSSYKSSILKYCSGFYNNIFNKPIGESNEIIKNFHYYKYREKFENNKIIVLNLTSLQSKIKYNNEIVDIYDIFSVIRNNNICLFVIFAKLFKIESEKLFDNLLQKIMGSLLSNDNVTLYHKKIIKIYKKYMEIELTMMNNYNKNIINYEMKDTCLKLSKITFILPPNFTILVEQFNKWNIRFSEKEIEYFNNFFKQISIELKEEYIYKIKLEFYSNLMKIKEIIEKLSIDNLRNYDCEIQNENYLNFVNYINNFNIE